uniref:Attacin C-terminal domain-containing protein n=1 Tax=Glossina pallidipes TaxID=7398 RepID=A0A1B0A5F4_GLOPL
MSTFIILLAILVACYSVTAGSIGDYSNELSYHQDSLGDFGDHLDESHFPTDFHGGSSEHDHLFSAAVSDGHEFAGEEYSHKPVPGIDHGKGVISYSSFVMSNEISSTPT